MSSDFLLIFNMDPVGIHMLKNFRIWFRFRGNIRRESSKFAGEILTIFESFTKNNLVTLFFVASSLTVSKKPGKNNVIVPTNKTKRVYNAFKITK